MVSSIEVYCGESLAHFPTLILMLDFSGVGILSINPLCTFGRRVVELDTSASGSNPLYRVTFEAMYGCNPKHYKLTPILVSLLLAAREES